MPAGSPSPPPPDGATGRVAVAIIPARLQSSRLPRKLLLAESGRPLLQHTYEAALQIGLLSRVTVATDSEEIEAAARAFGAPVVLTSRDCPSGTDRVLEAALALGLPETSVVVNLQGDEPEITPSIVEGLLHRLAREEDLAVVTHAFGISPREAEDPALVKVVVDARQRALYFSRAAVPHHRDPPGVEAGFLGHAGIYAFRLPALRRFGSLGPSPLERVESLEQLRFLEAGLPVGVVVGERPGIGIDTRSDYDGFLARHRAREGQHDR